ncbi:hypothetical protein [Budvicia aquatica]|uniref:Uncharacterized protein n=1 Tax=Budvicia aquatica TaxID=82979 RepID=A0A2C6DP40_9GAMM|nr:hypothetical protein [Budvicia aquatica]PHI30463.1 hypothetical protein CRN84_14510 [Budvicia aquatica]VFS49677.1 Uncharacterised protein [Budvicia aquatica]
MKKVMLGVVLAMFSASSFADDFDVKQIIKSACSEQNAKAQASCEQMVKIVTVHSFTSGRLSGRCEYEIRLNKNKKEIQNCENILSGSQFQAYYELDEELRK